ncbi:type-2 ice-structuring protein-like isoform X2 [Corythoichthys intestinalis]|uniref:type-2 ice-structuring protein-like isoform X2 n=1 Tax=Corythoichthys intestinalis TaxID=161448 RepID=UPI0025A555C1|nr:type-2 ice-structuring protein-like isoform X2 [Corythoichthys intestinalis]
MLSLSLVFCAIVALVTAQAATQAPTACPAGWNKYKDRCYFFDNNAKIWVDAEAACQGMGGNLASVRSDDENTFLRTLTNNATTWLGGTDCQTAGAWFWMDGTQMLARFWCPLKPDNQLSQCCLQMNTGENKCWDDVPCNSTLPFVCARHI